MTSIKRTGLLLAGLLIAVLAMSGVVRARENESTAQTLTSQENPLTIALAYLEQNKESLGLSAADLAEVKVTDTTVSRLSGVTTIYFVQQLEGIEVFNGLINISIMPNGDVLTVGSRFVPNLAGSVSERSATLSAAQAVQIAANHVGLTIQSPLQTLEQGSGTAQETLFSNGSISQNPIPAKLVYDASGKVPRLAWNVIIYQLDSLHWWNVRVDANTGEILSKNDWVVNENFDAHGGGGHGAVAAAPAMTNAGQEVPFGPTPVADGSSYRVYHLPIESPSHSSPPTPADGRTLQNTPADAGGGSPFGWHDTNGAAGAEFTTTQGNNAHAYTDVDANNTPDAGSSPDGGVGLDFDFPLDLTQAPSAYRPAAVTNLFHWNNLIHDINYRYGFDEVHGNFQENNYGNGGLGNDYVYAEAQDGSGTNNANFATPPDGSNPRMQMYIWTAPTPDRDGDLDNGIVAHEYGHGISNRMVGGPSNVNCLNNAEQMGEGWSDWQAVIMTMRNGDTATTNRGVGTYALNQPINGVGIRPAPYNTDMSINGYTYGNLPGMAVPHGVGFVWATMLWEMNWGLIAEHGFNQDLYLPNTPVNTWSGNQLAHALVTEGFNLTPCSPGFVDGRDAILAADVALTGGVNQCIIWQAFANRGLGFSASQGSSASTGDGTEAFDLPPACLTLNIPITSIDICQGDTAVYNIGVGVAYTPPVTMSATDNPAPSTAVFTPNPVPATPGTTDLTIANTGAVAAGSYTINIVANDGSVSDNEDVDLNVFAAMPGAPTLLSPASGATGVSTLPTLSWNAVADGIGYEVEIATDPGFTNIVYAAAEPTTSHAVGTALNPTTLYFWRVRAQNPCGFGPFAAPFSFITGNLSVLLVDDDDNTPDVRATYTSALNNLGVTYDIWDTTNSDNEPTAVQLAAYHTVIWFTGDEFGGFAGPGTAGEAALGSWLNTNTCLFISSQDYHWDRGLTPFMSTYLGVASATSDTGNYTSVTGQGTVFGGLGPYGLTYPFADFSDIVNPDGTAETAFQGNNLNYGAVNKDNGVYRTTFWGFPWEAINTAVNREQAMQTVLNWCAPLTGSTAVWDGGGITNDWSEATNWVGDVVPQATDTVLFDTTSTKDALLDITFPGTVANIIINSDYTGTITMDRPFTVTNDYTQVDGVFVISDPATAVMTVGGNMTHIGGILRQTQTVNSMAVPFLQIEDGAATVKYRGATLDATPYSSNLGAVTVNIRAIDRVTQFCTNTGAMSGPYAGRCFDVTPTITGTAMLRLYALTSELPGGMFSPAVYHDTTGSGNWVRLTTNADTNTIGAYTYAEAEATGFSPFLIGDEVETPTAVTLTNLTTANGNTVLLTAVFMLFLLMLTGIFIWVQRQVK